VADQQQVRGDSKYTGYLVTGPTVTVVYLDLNVREHPTNDPLVRQAVAMAINRTKLSKLLGGTGSPAGNLYIPVYPQHDPMLDQHPVYAYDPQKAAAMLKKSSYHGAPITILYPNDVPQQVSLSPGIAQDLQQVGFNVTLRGISNSSLFSYVGSLTGHPITQFEWSPDYADAYDMYSARLSCDSSAAGQGSPAHYCNPAADALVNRAETVPLGAERDALLRQAQLLLLQSAAHVPVAYLNTVVMVSPRIGGYYYQPLFGWQFENYWIKQ
jgi:ABC-type transport system substrate-binding protein